MSREWTAATRGQHHERQFYPAQDHSFHSSARMEIRMGLPRAEYPRPQFERADWKNLNGTWSYTFDFGKSGIERGFASCGGFDGQIVVPFCPESELSGVGHTDFIEVMWYH